MCTHMCAHVHIHMCCSSVIIARYAHYRHMCVHAHLVHMQRCMCTHITHTYAHTCASSLASACTRCVHMCMCVSCSVYTCMSMYTCAHYYYYYYFDQKHNCVPHMFLCFINIFDKALMGYMCVCTLLLSRIYAFSICASI